MIPDAPRTLTDEEEMVATLKGATALHILQRRRVTAAQLADELGCTSRHAYRVLQRLELSRRFAVVYERPFWHISEDVT